MSVDPRIHHGRFKYALTDEQVKAILIKWRDTRDLPDGDPNKPTYRTFMDEYGIGNNTIWKVLSRQSYKWVQIDEEEPDIEDDSQGSGDI